MATYYVRPSGGSDSNDGKSYAQAFATLGKAATSVAAGDTVYIAPGSYYESVTISTSGTNGSPVQWIGDYLGTNTDGVGGVVRWTGLATNNQSHSRSNCVNANLKNYQTFKNIAFDGAQTQIISATDGVGWVFQNCYFGLMQSSASGDHIICSGSAQSGWTIQNCYFLCPSGAYPAGAILFQHSADVAAAGHVVQNCVLISLGSCVISNRVRGITVNNCLVMSLGYAAISIANEGSAGATHITVTNSIITCSFAGFKGVATGDIVEDYNNVSNTGTARTNTATGAHSNAYPMNFDTRWFFQMVLAGAGPNSSKQMVSPFDLASYNALIDVAGTSPTSTDMRGTSAINSVREWGALEYDSTLRIQGSTPGGAVGIRTGGKL